MGRFWLYNEHLSQFFCHSGQPQQYKSPMTQLFGIFFGQTLLFSLSTFFLGLPNNAYASKKWKFATELLKIGDQKWIRFDSVRCNHLDTTRHKLAMEEKEVNYDFGLKDARVKDLKRTTDNIAKSNKCNQCDFASSQAGNLKIYLKTHSGEKSNKCNQCDYAASREDALRTHLKTHSGEKSNKCNQCDYASIQAGSLRRHLKMHSREK